MRRDKLDQFFDLTARGTSVKTEILAGLSTFLSVAYIFLLGPTILSDAGIDWRAAFFAGAVAASLGTIVMGLWANLPFAVAPGITMSTYFAYVVVARDGLSWQQGLAAVFISGMLCVLLTALPVRQKLIASIPFGLKQSIATAVGTFVLAIGLFLGGIITPGSPIITLNLPVGETASLLAPLTFLVGLAVSGAFLLPRFRAFPGGAVVAILAATSFFWWQNDAPISQAGGGNPFSAVAQLSFSGLFTTALLVPIIIFFILDFFESVGEFIGLTTGTSVQTEEAGVIGLEKGLYVDSASTVGGSLLGTSSLIIFVESAVGIRAGGRTGLTALTCGLLMTLIATLGYFLSPILASIPAVAASGILVFVGIDLIRTTMGIKTQSSWTLADRAISVAMALTALLTFSLDKPLLVGFAAYFVLSWVRGQFLFWLGAVAALLAFAVLVGH